MNNLEAIWWETQDIDVNKNRIGNPTLHVHFIRKNEEGVTHGIVHSKEVTQGLNVDTIKNEIIKEIIEVTKMGVVADTSETTDVDTVEAVEPAVKTTRKSANKG